MPSLKHSTHAKNDRRVVFVRPRLVPQRRRWWAFYFRVLLKSEADYFARVAMVYSIHMREGGKCIMRGWSLAYETTTTTSDYYRVLLGSSSGTTTYPLTYWTATTS